MPGLVPGIHVFAELKRRKDVDGRDKPGHDGLFEGVGNQISLDRP
jgi:hypothetical protein